MSFIPLTKLPPANTAVFGHKYPFPPSTPRHIGGDLPVLGYNLRLLSLLESLHLHLRTLFFSVIIAVTDALASAADRRKGCSSVVMSADSRRACLLLLGLMSAQGLKCLEHVLVVNLDGSHGRLNLFGLEDTGRQLQGTNGLEHMLIVNLNRTYDRLNLLGLKEAWRWRHGGNAGVVHLRLHGNVILSSNDHHVVVGGVRVTHFRVQVHVEARVDRALPHDGVWSYVGGNMRRVETLTQGDLTSEREDGGPRGCRADVNIL